jgi:ankyrin repeat protein
MNRFILSICCVIAWVVAFGAPLFAEVSKESLASLIQAGNHKEALARIRAGADVNEAQPDGTRPIHWAVYHVDHELLGSLLAKKANVNVRNEFGSTPIAEAANLGDARMVKMLLDAGAEPEGANTDGQTALMLGINTGELPVVEMLIKAGARVNRIEELRNQTPLMWAAVAPRNAGQMVKLLLAKGADVRPRALYTDWPNQITSEPRAQYRPVGGLTALLYAARDGCYDCVEALIGAGAGVNVPTPEGATALMLALDNQHNDVAKLLLDRGANPHVWDWWGRTALYIVVDRREAALAPARGSGGGGVTRASDRSLVSSMEIISTLLTAGVDPNTQLNMHRPSRGGNSGRFGDPLLSTGCTPLLRATMANDMDVVQALLAKGASPNINDMGVTAFLVAAGLGGGRGFGGQAGASGVANIPLMDLLLQHGADVNAQVAGTKTYSMRVARAPSANEGMSALHVAAQSGRADLVRYLLDKGANAEIVDNNGHKPIDLVGITPAPGRGGAAPDAASPATAQPSAPGAGGRGGPAGGNSTTRAANVAEIRELLRDSVSRK